MIPKFRAWYKEWKEMGRVGEIIFDLDGNVSVVLFKGNYLDVSGPREKIILMQSTGLFDKNGKEIFDGDILTDGHTTGDIRNHPTLGFYMVDKKGRENYLSDTVDTDGFEEAKEFMRNSIEVIGNVYENPELLEVTE